MNKRILAAGLLSILIAGSALADEHCEDPVDRWQHRDALRHKLERNGWRVHRIKIDDDCYEVKGIDRHGNRFKAKYEPASLKIRELEIRFDKDGNAADYLDQNLSGDSAPAEKAAPDNTSGENTSGDKAPPQETSVEKSSADNIPAPSNGEPAP